MPSCNRCNNSPATQPFPQQGMLARRLDQNLPGFTDKSPPSSWGPDPVYAYVLTTVKVENNGFRQTGSAPNYQGGLITLCTCMHWQRTWSTIKEHVWIAGFCGSGCPGGNQLFYLMQIKNTHDDFQSLWNTLPEMIRQAKNASRSIYGDCYEPGPKMTATTNHSPQAYVTPLLGHAHRQHAGDENWRVDVSLCHERVSKLLVGNPETSFIWTVPRYRHKAPLYRGMHHYDSPTKFYKCLEIVQ